MMKKRREFLHSALLVCWSGPLVGGAVSPSYLMVRDEKERKSRKKERKKERKKDNHLQYFGHDCCCAERKKYPFIAGT